MGPFDDPTQLAPAEAERHRQEYLRRIAENRARKLGGPAATGHSDETDYSKIDRGAIAEGGRPEPAAPVPPTALQRAWTGVLKVVLFFLGLWVASAFLGMPVRGVY